MVVEVNGRRGIVHLKNRRVMEKSISKSQKLLQRLLPKVATVVRCVECRSKDIMATLPSRRGEVGRIMYCEMDGLRLILMMQILNTILMTLKKVGVRLGTVPRSWQ